MSGREGKGDRGCYEAFSDDMIKNKREVTKVYVTTLFFFSGS